MPLVKSMTRKDNSFGQLVNYLHKEEPTFGELVGYIHKEKDQENKVTTLLHNIPEIEPDDIEGIIEAFKENDTYRRQRKNGIVQYHEVVSFSPSDTEKLIQNPSILMDMARKYLQLRAPNSLAIARPHFDEEHLHVHIMISGNCRESKEPSRISQKDFEKVKQELNEYQQSQYPELSNSVIEEHQAPRKKTEELLKAEPVPLPAKHQLQTSEVTQAEELDEAEELVLDIGDQEIESPYWDFENTEDDAMESPYWDTEEPEQDSIESPYWDTEDDSEDEPDDKSDDESEE
jgi:hypothetical protein